MLDIAANKGVKRLNRGYAITPQDLKDCLQAEGLKTEPGDIILVRTGLIRVFYDEGVVAFQGGIGRENEEGKRIYAKRGYTVEPVFGEIKWDGRKLSMDLRGSVKVRGEFSLMCLVHNVKKIMKKVLEGTVSLPGKYSKLIEEALPGYREKQLTLVGAKI